MRCNASPTTSTAADPASAAPQSGAARPDETAVFTAMLASSIAEPLTKSLGPLGAVFGDALARAAIGRGEPAP
jgi:hypothetical protein